MIDFESALFDELYEEIIVDAPNAYITGERVSTPAKFPCISIVEIDNATFRNSLVSEREDRDIAVTYEVGIYSNKTSTKKSECKKLAGIIDKALSKRNFTRMSFIPVPNATDPSIYRMVGRYRAVISKDFLIYRR